MGWVKHSVLTGEWHPWVEELTKQNVIPQMVRRVIIDIPWGEKPTVYYESMSDEAVFKIDCADMLKGAKAISVTEAAKTP